MLSQVAAVALLAVVGVPFQQASAPERPRDVWAFRSVLDQRARMLTIALHKDLWVAYDATNCGLYRAWRGNVRLEGAVYTNTHGPQPTATGDVRLHGLIDQPVWSLQRAGKPVAAQSEFKGYRKQAGGIVLQYRMRLPDRREIWIYEQPEALEQGGQVGLERIFQVTGLRRDERVGVAVLVPTSGSPSVPASGTTEHDGTMESVGTRASSSAGYQQATIWLNPGTTRLRHRFSGGNEPDAAGLFASLRGSSAAHQQDPMPARHVPGAAMRVYWIGHNLSQIPTLMAGQTPNYSVIIPNIELRGHAGFGMPEAQKDHFYVKVTGYLTVEREGDYRFRLSSDDGSKFSIRDEIVIDHDGLHGESPSKTGSLRLAPGAHPFEIEYFENSVDEMLRLEWSPPGSSSFEVVPPSAFSTPDGEVRVTAPGRKIVFDPGKRWRPGDGLPLDSVHPAFDLTTVRPRDFRPRVGGMDFLPDGRLVVCTWDADGAVYILDGVSDPNPNRVRVKRIAAGLAEPLGLKVVDGQIYVLQKQELTLLRDLNGDEIIDEYLTVANGWGVTPNFHEFAFGLVYDRSHFYAALAIAIDPGGASTKNQNPDRGKVIKIAKNGDYEFVAEGLRTPNGIGIGYNRGIFITDNQGDWLPSSKVLHLTEGAFFGSKAVDPVGTRNKIEKPPVVWLPQNEIGNSPSQPAVLNVGPYRNQMIHGEVTHGGVKRVFVEEVDGQLQGCVFRFTQGLEAGINRLAWGPDGALYVGGIGSTGNWGQEGKERFGLQRLRYNGKSVFEMLAVRAKTNGLEIELTDPLQEGMGEGAGDYLVRTWRYVPNAEYGGPKIDERSLRVAGVRVMPNRRRVFLELPDMRSGHVVYIKLNRGLTSRNGQDLWSTEAWYTLNRIPSGRVVRVPNASAQTNTLGADEARQGFALLFDGKSLDAFRGYRRTDVPAGWSAVEGELRFTPGQGGGDLATRESYGDFELRLDWKVSPGGNSGIMYRVTEDRTYPWETGPEYQVLDDDLHPDGRSPLTSAASAYGLYARSRDLVRPAGFWNETRIVVKGDSVEHWLNGVKVVEYRLNSADWKKRVAESKFSSMPDYGQRKAGHIVLQDHGDLVSYRNIRIRRL
jgi:cytochrome c